MDTAAPFVALNRFGLGRRPDQDIPTDPRAWLRAQLTGPDTTPTDGLPDTQGALAVVAQEIELDKQFRRTHSGIAKSGMAQPDAAPGQPTAMSSPSASPAPEAKRDRPAVDLTHKEAHALLSRSVTTDAPFRERLVLFWANHFTVANKSLANVACNGAYIREAIRPHVTGRFADMLLAVMRHPAMLAYLNQEGSAGPDSIAAHRRHIGLNENLARESLELHTVSPAARYTQADVTAYARLLAGWSFSVREAPTGFRYRQAFAEPGQQTIMGRTWPEGEAGGVAILAWLGTHPATYRHIAEKLTRHFISDAPTDAQISQIVAVLQSTDGNIGAAANTLIDMPGAWVPCTKLRTPQEFVVASLRAINADPARLPNLGSMVAGLGQKVFDAPFPIGWPDRAADWAGPEAMLQRVDFAYGLSNRVANLDPEPLGRSLLGPLLTDTTLGQIRAAGSRRDGITLLLSSPEFQRR